MSDVSIHCISILDCNPMKSMICNECESPLMRRSDDEEQSIYERLRIYHEHEKDLSRFSRKLDKPVHTVEAHMPLEEVYDHLSK